MGPRRLPYLSSEPKRRPDERTCSRYVITHLNARRIMRADIERCHGARSCARDSLAIRDLFHETPRTAVGAFHENRRFLGTMHAASRVRGLRNPG